MAKPQRFSGPELSELLDRVVSELGPAAEISAVNKIRSGGVAGFFCREEYEIIVGAGTKARRPMQEQSTPPQAEQSHAEQPQAEQSQIGQSQIEEQQPPEIAMANAEHPTVNGGPIIAAAKAGAPNSEPSVDAVDGASEIFGGPRPRASNGTDARFMALLERRLDEASETEAQLAERRARRPKPQPSATLPIDEPKSHALTPARPSADVPLQGAEAQTDVHETRDFWARISKTRQELTTFMPTNAPFVAVIGPLSLTTPVVRRLRSESELGAADVVVLTDRAEIVSEPTWQLVRSGHQLVDLAKERADWPTILVIDVPVELPQWLAPLQQRLRLAGVGVFHYAVPGDPSAGRLDDYRSASDVPYVLDLISRVDAERVVGLIAERHPVGSVGGAALTPELLLAMREQVHGG